MSQLAMPLLVINLGCEMLYILEQRLKAQSIPLDKSVKVLNDVVRTMFDKDYVTKLIAPQDIYSMSSTQKIFDRLAHSSIMRLSESSMDKLFDLMIMGVKYQVLCGKNLDDVVQATHLHLQTVKAMLSNVADAAVIDLVVNAENTTKALYGSMTMGQLQQLRQTLMRFFQDKRVKVSLFLQEGIQAMNGRIFLPTACANGIGEAVYYDVNGKVESKEKLTLDILKHDPNNFFVHPCLLGTNLYTKDRPKVVPPARKGELMGAPITPAEAKSAGGADEGAKGNEGARRELDLLTSLLAVPKGPEKDNFKLNLFGDGGDDDVYTTAPVVSSTTGGVPSLSFGSGGKNDAYKKDSLAGVMKGLNVEDKDDDDGDLLSLMDKAK